jgi:ketosteroid isomerase-like protein
LQPRSTTAGKPYENDRIFVRTIGWLLVLVCATSPPVRAQGPADTDAATAIRALEHEWYEAQSHNDNRALDLIFDNALVYIEYGSLVSKGDYLLRVRSAKAQPEQIVMEPLMVRTFGSTVIVIGSYRETTVKDGKPWRRRWRFVDSWVYEQGRWMLVAAAAAPLLK